MWLTSVQLWHPQRILNSCTYNAYCIAPSFFSWLGNGTSRLIFPDAVKDDVDSGCLSMAFADITAEREIHARCSRCLEMAIECRDAVASEYSGFTEDRVASETHDEIVQLV